MVKIHEKDTAALEDGSLGDSADRITEVEGTIDTTGDEPKGEQPDWLGLAKNAYEDSTRFLDSSLRWKWERNIRAFQSRHPTGSKYLSESFRHRSKLFRPKTRSMIRTMEAATAAAFFANEDVVSVSATNDNDQANKASAELNKQLLQYRLTTANPNVAIQWFPTVIGGMQDAQIYGIVCSKQWWEYKEVMREKPFPVLDPMTGAPLVNPMTGEPVQEMREAPHVLVDRPRCDLIAPENLRIDRAADWRDPINSSPYVIILHPMYVIDVEARMKRPDPKSGQPPWKTLDRTQLKQATNRQIWDSTRSHREQNREDSKDSEISIDEYWTVWMHENIMRWTDGNDYVFWTAGTHYLVSDPLPLEEVYRHARKGSRPITMGYGLIETHKNYPDAKPQLTEGLQSEANELVNLRLDNIKLALTKRYKVRRGRNIDIRQLTRVVPGAVTLVHDKDDVEEMEFRDVTQSSFLEQDRINADFDDVAGNFSQGSVATNRRMNETVGGMNLLSRQANSIGDLDMRVFTETWVEPTLRQIVAMEQVYESDAPILALAAENAKLYQKYNINTITDQLLDQELTLKVNVGIGATDPMQRLQKFMMGGEALAKVLGPAIEGLLPMLNIREIVKEIFSAIGYRDGARFFNFDDNVDPMVQILQQQIQELRQQIERREVDAEAKRDVARMGAASRVAQQVIENQGSMAEERLRAGAQQVMGRENQMDELKKLLLKSIFDDMRQDKQVEAQRQTRAASSGAR